MKQGRCGILFPLTEVCGTLLNSQASTAGAALCDRSDGMRFYERACQEQAATLAAGFRGLLQCPNDLVRGSVRLLLFWLMTVVVFFTSTSRLIPRPSGQHSKSAFMRVTWRYSSCLRGG
jgi:hypothetical protein